MFDSINDKLHDEWTSFLWIQLETERRKDFVSMNPLKMVIQKVRAIRASFFSRLPILILIRFFPSDFPESMLAKCLEKQILVPMHLEENPIVGTLDGLESFFY